MHEESNTDKDDKDDFRLILIFAFVICILIILATSVVILVAVQSNNRKNNVTNLSAQPKILSMSPSAQPSDMPSEVPSLAPKIGNWQEILTKYEDKIQSNTYYGQCVAWADSGDKLFIGSDFETHVYSLDGQNTTKLWTIPGRCDGITLSRNADVVAIANDRYSNFKGIVRVYIQRRDNSWEQRGDNLIGNEELDMFGKDVSFSTDGNVLAIWYRRYRVGGWFICNCIQVEWCGVENKREYDSRS